MKKLLILVILLIISCSKSTVVEVEGIPGTPGAPGLPGTPGPSVGVHSSPAAACPSGGHTLTFFRDNNSNNILDSGEMVLSVNVICNGAPANLVISPASSSQCPNGGIVVNGSHILCNGTTVRAVKFCPADNHQFAEYGFIIGTQLYGVLGNTSVTPAQIGLVTLTPGTWMTTTHSTNHIFTYTNDGSTITLTCGSQTAVYPIP